jgi:hypothetical protein
VYDCSSLDGAYCVAHRWTWDPGITFGWVQLLLEDKRYSSREDCNVPTLGHRDITECYDDQSSQMEIIASTRSIEGILGSSLHRSSYFIIMIHSAQLGFGSVAFRRFPLF